jgi:xylose isomerase
VKQFAIGSMRTYEILAEKVRKWNADKGIAALLKEINVQDATLSKLTKSYSSANARKLLAAPLDRVQLAKARLPYERLDQLTLEVLLGAR